MTEAIITQRAYKFRLYPSPAQQTQLEQTLGLCSELYNAALQERRDAYRVARKSVTYNEQQNQLPEIKDLRLEFASVHSQVLQDVLRRLDKAFDNFFRRVKTRNGTPGFPRFRSRARYDSFTYPQSGFVLKAKKLQLSKIGNLKIKNHREIEGKVKTCTITRSATGKWFVCFSVEVESLPLPESHASVGIDVGVKEFAVLSTGEPIPNPRFFRQEENELAKAQRRLSATPKGSKERKKRRQVVARVHERIKNKRQNFAHQQSRQLVNRFGVLIFEKLNIKGMLKNHHLAKSIADAAWSQFVHYTEYKAAEAGRTCRQINPRYSSQVCSRCGEIVEKDLRVRMHDCQGCGLRIDRDHNAAINILALGLQSLVHRDIEAASL